MALNKQINKWKKLCSPWVFVMSRLNLCSPQQNSSNILHTQKSLQTTLLLRQHILEDNGHHQDNP